MHGSAVDDGAPLVAAAMLLCAELAAWSLDERQRDRGGACGRRRASHGASARSLPASLAAAGLVVALSLAPGSGLAWTVLGAAAALLVVGVAVRLARRASA